MRTKSAIILVLMTFGLLISCDYERIRASGEVTTLEYFIPEYTGLKVSSAFDAFVTFSDTEESIRIEANENIHDRIVVKRDGNTLVIGLKKFTQIRGNAILNVYISTKHLSHFDMSGASSLTLINEWDIQDARIDMSGASEFSGEVVADRLHIDMNGASNLDVYGSVNEMHAELSGSSEIMDYDLYVARLDIEMSGASEAYLFVSESIDIEATGASVLNYKGNAVITHQELSGASEIRNSN